MISVPKWVCGRNIPVLFQSTGARFRVKPIISHRKHRPEPKNAPECSPGRRPRLLLLDDNPIFLRALGRLLETYSFDVDMEGCHKAAYDRFSKKKSTYDFALVDVHLNGSSCWDFAKKISRFPDAPPILLMSGEAQSIAADAPKNVKGVLTKPFSVKRLQEEINSWGKTA